MARYLETNAKRLQVAQERDQARFEAVAAEDRASQGWVDLALSLVTIAVGVAAIVMTAGAATPLVVGACVVGSCTAAYGASNLYEAGHNIYLGSVGDGLTVATNPLRDTLFMGNDRLYHQVGGLFTTASAAMIPIGQTKSVAKGLTEFTIGEVGGFIGGQASYHGTRLLGGSEQDAQRATLVGNILGGLAASSAARRFSLNEPIAAKVTKPIYKRQQLLKNIEHSRLARESSNFGGYIKKESVTKYPTQIDNKVTVGAKENLPSWIADSFTDSHYRTVITGEEITLYRTFGGASDAGGGFVTTVPATNRIQAKIDTALLPEWKNTRQYEAVIKIPKGSQLNIGCPPDG
ncbi:hypothetical protein RIM63_01335 [Streptococcus equi subsp. zooepidemicus]|uniref:hypothetical protein n=1 Tax=Streptococcus equi TaxID=1336 RepID=UPI00294AD829|nr:hypothetical protein [Streptococcus equi]WOK57439.1 hypothetical protein RIM63_01335 [Streptococcus equi subsp. zooepidemicus]